MNAYGSTGLFGMLVATSLVSGATGMEINQQRAASTGNGPAFTMPAFLDGARLPDLQDAWRAHFSGAAAVVQPASEMTPSGPEVLQQPVTPAGQTGSDAAAVRSRAEELSSRFGADTQSAPAAEANAPTETASINTDATGAEPGQPVVEQVLAPADDAAVSDVAASTEGAPIIEDMGTRPAKAANRNMAGAPIRPTAQTPVRTPSMQALLKVDPAAPKPDSDPLMPSQLRAFGWNAQP